MYLGRKNMKRNEAFKKRIWCVPLFVFNSPRIMDIRSIKKAADPRSHTCANHLKHTQWLVGHFQVWCGLVGDSQECLLITSVANGPCTRYLTRSTLTILNLGSIKLGRIYGFVFLLEPVSYLVWHCDWKNSTIKDLNLKYI